MKNLLLLLLMSAFACEKNITVLDTATCETTAQAEKEALDFLKGRWKLTEIHAGRAGKQPVTVSVELNFDGTMVEIVENGKKTSTRYQVYTEAGSNMLRLSPPTEQSLFEEVYQYFSGYLMVCDAQLQVGMGPVDGTNYVYQRIK